MPVQKISIEAFCPDDDVKYTESVINFIGKQVTIEFYWVGTRYIYKGSEVASLPGKYELTCSESGGRATLYRLPGNERAICHWRDPDHQQGMWEIDLEEDEKFL